MVCCMGGAGFASNAQSVTPATLNAAGGTAIYTFYRFEWSVGEAAAIETFVSNNLIVTSGVLQPGTNKPVYVNNEQSWAKDEIKILPNPTRDWIEIDFFSKHTGKISLILIDATGKTIHSKQIDYHGIGHIEKMNLSAYAAGQYFLNIILVPTGPSVAKKGTFKIQKLN